MDRGKEKRPEVRPFDTETARELYYSGGGFYIVLRSAKPDLTQDALDTLAGLNHKADFTKVTDRNRAGEPVGWFFYDDNNGGRGCTGAKCLRYLSGFALQGRFVRRGCGYGTEYWQEDYFHPISDPDGLKAPRWYKGRGRYIRCALIYLNGAEVLHIDKYTTLEIRRVTEE